MNLFLWGWLWVGSIFAVDTIVYDATEIWVKQNSVIHLIGGVSLNGLEKPHRGERLLFEDLRPRANWEHPANFKIVNSQGQILRNFSVRLPPENLDKLPIVSGNLPKAKRVNVTLKDFGGTYKVSDPSKYYAVLINGAANQRHWNDFSFLYHTLITVYGYDRANIFVADSNFKDEQPDLDGDGTADIGSGSTLAEVKSLFGQLKDRLKPTDHLLIAVNDHGSTASGEATIVLNDAQVSAFEFKKWVDALPPQQLLAIYEQCFSGGFVRPTVSDTRVAMSAATETESSWATADLDWDEFIYHVIAAFAMQTHDGSPITVELDPQKRVSAHAAFAYAATKDAASESPKLEAFANTGYSSKIGLGF